MVTDTDVPEFNESVALRALIEADARLTGRVGLGSAIVPGHEGEDPAPLLAPPYVVLYRDTDADTSDRLAGPTVLRHPSWILHAVGASELAALAVLGWVDAQLRPPGGVAPDVEGQRTKRITRTEFAGVAIDDDTPPPVFYAIARYSFESRRATTIIH